MVLVVSKAVQLCYESAVAYLSQSSLQQALCWGTNPFLVLALLASIDGYLHLSLPPFACLVSLSVSFYRLFILPFFYSNFCLLCSIVLFNFVSLCIFFILFQLFFFYLSFRCCVSLFFCHSYFPSSFFHINISIARRWCCPCNPHPNTINMKVTTTFWLRYRTIYQAVNVVRRYGHLCISIIAYHTRSEYLRRSHLNSKLLLFVCIVQLYVKIKCTLVLYRH